MKSALHLPWCPNHASKHLERSPRSRTRGTREGPGSAAPTGPPPSLPGREGGAAPALAQKQGLAATPHLVGEAQPLRGLLLKSSSRPNQRLPSPELGAPGGHRARGWATIWSVLPIHAGYPHPHSGLSLQPAPIPSLLRAGPGLGSWGEVGSFPPGPALPSQSQGPCLCVSPLDGPPSPPQREGEMWAGSLEERTAPPEKGRA